MAAGLKARLYFWFWQRPGLIPVLVNL